MTSGTVIRMQPCRRRAAGRPGDAGAVDAHAVDDPVMSMPCTGSITYCSLCDLLSPRAKGRLLVEFSDLSDLTEKNPMAGRRCSLSWWS